MTYRRHSSPERPLLLTNTSKRPCLDQVPCNWDTYEESCRAHPEALVSRSVSVIVIDGQVHGFYYQSMFIILKPAYSGILNKRVFPSLVSYVTL